MFEVYPESFHPQADLAFDEVENCTRRRACQGCPNKMWCFARVFFCGSTLTVLAEPGTWLVRKARQDFQPEIPASTFSRKPRARRHQSRWREIQEYHFKIYG
jgi:hypothetical protein